MNTDNDYLWDRTGAVDPEVKHLEELLSTFRSQPAASPLPLPARSWNVSVWAVAPLAAAATLVIGLFGAYKSPVSPQHTWSVERVAGRPTIDSRELVDAGTVASGDMIQTDDSSKAVIEVGKIGTVLIEPNSKVRLLRTDPAHNRLALDRGTMHATIWAPPRLFFVETPSATAIDLGCAYTLTVDHNGNGRLCVTSGWVAFEKDGHETVVPSGAICETRSGIGPGTPYFGGASDEFRLALQRFDFGGASTEDLEAVLREANMCEVFTLWQLLPHVRGDQRAMVFDRMAQLMPPPPGVTREGVLALDAGMLQAWGIAFTGDEFMPCLTSCMAEVVGGFDHRS